MNLFRPIELGEHLTSILHWKCPFASGAWSKGQPHSNGAELDVIRVGYPHNPLKTPEYYKALRQFYKDHKGQVPRLVTPYKGIIRTSKPESRVTGLRGSASGGARVARDRKDVNARASAIPMPVNDGKGAGKAKPVG